MNQTTEKETTESKVEDFAYVLAEDATWRGVDEMERGLAWKALAEVDRDAAERVRDVVALVLEDEIADRLRDDVLNALRESSNANLERAAELAKVRGDEAWDQFEAEGVDNDA